MFIKDPFVIGPAVPLTDQQKSDKALEDEWNAIGKPTLEERIAERNRVIAESVKREWGLK
jgi:hypothetical protein